MEEENQKIEDLKKQIEEMQKIYDADLERGKNPENDQIQASRQKKIDSLNEELLKEQPVIDERESNVDGIVGKKEVVESFEIENDNGQKFLITPLENDINGLSKYKMTPMINGVYNETNSQNIFMNSPIEFDKVNSDKEYTEAIKDLFNSDRIESRREEARKFNTNSLYMGNLHREENGYYQKQRIVGNRLYHVYNGIKESDYFDEREQKALNSMEKETLAFEKMSRKSSDSDITRLVESPSLKAQMKELPDPNRRYKSVMIWGRADIRLLPNGWVRVKDWAIKREDNTEVILQELNTDIEGVYKYRVLYDFYDKPSEENSRVFYSDGIDFQKLRSDKKYAQTVSQLIDEERLDRREKIAKENGCKQSYIGTVIEKEDGSYEKAVRSPNDEEALYSKIQNLEREGKQVVSDEVKREEYKGALRYNQILETKQELREQEAKKAEEKRKKEAELEKNKNKSKENSSNTEKEEHIVINKPDWLREQKENSSNTEKKEHKESNIPDWLREQKENSSDAEKKVDQTINQQENSMTVYKKPNRFVSWIKEKFNNVKERFSKNKTNEEGQILQDYKEGQEENDSRKNKFFEEVTEKGKLQSEEQRKKQFEIAKKWAQQNKEEIEQGNNDRDL